MPRVESARCRRYERRYGTITSAKKAESNRRNALKSTGPKTPEGKAAVGLNALGHGLLSREVLLPGEDEEALMELDRHLRAELQPSGALENLLVDRAVGASWRLRRLGRVETGIFAWQLYGKLAERAQRAADTYVRVENPLDHLIAMALGTTSAVTDERKHKQALSRVQEMEAARDSESATLGQTFARHADSANAFSKLSRYETAIERQLYKALHELERRQAARHGGSVPPPQVVDVDVSGMPAGVPEGER
jgi:hypothetical protein